MIQLLQPRERPPDKDAVVLLGRQDVLRLLEVPDRSVYHGGEPGCPLVRPVGSRSLAGRSRLSPFHHPFSPLGEEGCLGLLKQAARSSRSRRRTVGAAIPPRLDDLGRQGREGNQDKPGEHAQEDDDPASDHEERGIRSHVPSIGTFACGQYPQAGYLGVPLAWAQCYPRRLCEGTACRTPW